MRLIFALIMVLMMTGCGNGVEISDRDFVVMAGVDKLDDRTYKATVGSAVLSGDENSGSVQVKSAEGESLPKALEHNDLSDALSPYYGHLKTVIFGENLLKDKAMLEKTIEVLTKNNDINLKTIVLGCDGKAEDCIKAASKKENDYGLYIWDFYKNGGKESAVTYKMTVNDMSMEKDGGFILPKASSEEEKITIGGGIVMDGTEFKGEIDENEMRSCLLAMEDIKGAVLELGGDAVKVKSNDRKIKFSQTDNSVLCSINIYMKVQPLTEKMDIEGATVMLRDEILDTIDKIYGEFETDAFGLYDRLEKFAPDMADKKMDFDVNVYMAAE